MKKLSELSERINKFDNWYMMSDCSRNYNNGLKEKQVIATMLNELNHKDLVKLKSMITNEQSLRTFSKHFEGLPEPSEQLDSQLFNNSIIGDNTNSHKSSLSTIMSNAWYYMKKGIYRSFSESLKAAWRAWRITRGLINGIVTFTYRKATGELRTAKGTLNSEFFEFTTKGVRSENKTDAIKYFDLEKNAWRMFRIERLINN